jgi:hypothetical protein
LPSSLSTLRVDAGRLGATNITVRRGTPDGIDNTGTLSLQYVTLTENRLAVFNRGVADIEHTTVASKDGGISNRGTISLFSMIIERNGFVLGHNGIGPAEIRNSTMRDDEGGIGTGTFPSPLLIADSAFIRNRGGIPGGFARIEQNTIVGNGGTGIQGRDMDTGVAIVQSVIYGNGGVGFSLAGGSIANSSIVRNRSGGIFYGSFAGLRVSSSTIAQNDTAGVRGVNGGNSLENTIVADNERDCGVDNRRMTSQGYNLIGDSTGCNVQPEATDMLDTPAGLDGFTDEGISGRAYIILSPESPAIDTGPDADACSEFDQLGNSRVGQCDRGAIEFQGGEGDGNL